MEGEPFIGIAGKKLSIALENAGITRDDVYITNIVKCRPQKIEFQQQMKGTLVKIILKKK